MKYSRAEVAEILRRMADGATAKIGGSRCNATYVCRDGAWMVEDFDEGHVRVFPSSRETVRELIRRHPEAFLGVLKQPRWERFSAAFLAGRSRSALKLLAEARRYGDPYEHGAILEAWLWFPARAPSRSIRSAIRTKFRDYTAYHVFMDAAGWDRSPESGRKGVLFVDRLIAMAGEAPGCFLVRAAFHEQAGDAAAAASDHALERERAQREVTPSRRPAGPARPSSPAPPHSA